MAVFYSWFYFRSTLHSNLDWYSTMSCYGSTTWFHVLLWWFHFLWFVTLLLFVGLQTAKLPLSYLTHLNLIMYNPFSNWTVSMTTPVFSAYIYLFAASADFFFLLFTETFKLLFFCVCNKIRFGELNVTLPVFFLGPLSLKLFWMVMPVWTLQNQSLRHSGRGHFKWLFFPNSSLYIYFIILFYL